MKATGNGRAFGVPKELVAAMLVVALVVTVAVDVSGSPSTPGALRVSPEAGSIVPGAHMPSTTTTLTAPPTSTAVPVPTTAPPPPPTGAHAAARAVPRSTPKPAPKPVPTPTPAGTARAVAFGAYVGAANPSALASFAAATGTHPLYASDYLPGNAGWTGMTNASSLSWLTNAWRGSGHVLILGVPLIPTDSSGNPQGTLAGGGAGQYDAQFVTLANTLVSAGDGNAVLRLGWEFNGNWYPWAVTDAADAANFVAYFRQIVTSMRSVPGQSFKFVWNPNAGGSYGSAYTPAQTYPGSAYVDYIGTDLYDQTWASPPTPQNAWAAQLAGAWGLDWLASFAAPQGRPVVFPEWGVASGDSGHGMGDDPYFIDQFGAWVASHDVAWTSYFNFDASDASHDLLDAGFAQSLAAFRAVFG